MFTIVCAVEQETGLIGVNNALPWVSRIDMQHFKSITARNNNDVVDPIVIMGRKTFQSLPQPLAQRQNYVISQSKKEDVLSREHKQRVYVFSSFNEALESAFATRARVYVIGGYRVFKDALQHPACAMIEMTIIKCKTQLRECANTNESMVYFPQIPPCWRNDTYNIIEDESCYCIFTQYTKI